MVSVEKVFINLDIVPLLYTIELLLGFILSNEISCCYLTFVFLFFSPLIEKRNANDFVHVAGLFVEFNPSVYIITQQWYGFVQPLSLMVMDLVNEFKCLFLLLVSNDSGYFINNLLRLRLAQSLDVKYARSTTHQHPAQAI